MKRILFFLFFLTASFVFSSEKIPAFRDGEKILFFGDSITHIGIYVNYLQLHQSLRHPEKKIRIINCGVSGNTVGLALARYDRDLMAESPDRVFIMFGMNDVGIDLYTDSPVTAQQKKKRVEALVRYRQNLTKLVSKLLADRKKVVMILTSPYDEYGTKQKRMKRTGLNEKGLAACTAIAKEIAEKQNLPVVDFYHPMTAIFKAHPEIVLCGDRIHPWTAGQMIMTSIILEAMGESPVIAFVEIDAEKMKANVRSGHVSDLRKEKNVLSFLYAPEFLPLFLNGECRAIDGKLYDLTGKLNSELLKITNLAPGRYQLKADEKVLGTFSASDFAKGINLAKYSTPSMQAAKKLDALLWKRHSTVQSLRFIREHERFVVEAGGNPKDLQSSLAAIDRWLSRRTSDKKVCEKNAAKYKKLKTEEISLQKRLLEQTEELRRRAKPEPYWIDIVPVR